MAVIYTDAAWCTLQYQLRSVCKGKGVTVGLTSMVTYAYVTTWNCSMLENIEFMCILDATC